MSNNTIFKFISVSEKLPEAVNLRQMVFEALASVPKDLLKTAHSKKEKPFKTFFIFSFLWKKEKKQKKKPFTLVKAQIFTLSSALL